MLRASSLGLRCYLRTLCCSSFPCHRFTPIVRAAWNSTWTQQPLVHPLERVDTLPAEEENPNHAQERNPSIENEVGESAKSAGEPKKSFRGVRPLQKGRYNFIQADIACRFPEDPKTGVRTALSPADVPPTASRRKLLYIIATTNSVDAAIQAYDQLAAFAAVRKRYPVPAAHLHRLARLIAQGRQRTRDLFIRLLSVLATLHRTGGQVQLWEWNALIDFAGKGWRKSRQIDYQTAFNVYCDMVSGKPPGSSFSREMQDGDSAFGEDGMRREVSHPVMPDIITYTTLLNIAGRAKQVSSVHRTSSLINSSGLRPNRITLLSLMNYHCRKDDLAGVRMLYHQIESYDFDVGIEGVNAVLFTYNRLGRRDVAAAMYTILKHSGDQQIERTHQQLREMAHDYLRDTEGLEIPELQPNKITYIGLIQSYAYHGYFVDAVGVFIDMMGIMSSDPEINTIKWLMPAYRALFCGFVRHGRPDDEADSTSSLDDDGKVKKGWTLRSLRALFNDFMGLPGEAKPSARMIYWILTAFERCSGYNEDVVADVYIQLRRRFGGGWGGRLKALGLRLSIEM